jgi:MFS family permease
MAGPQIPRDFRRVIVAASVGNVIEWYDFYIFGSLAAVLSVKFFEQSHPVAALLSTIALFTAGFLIRPLGAFLFGWMGDRIGRKYTFLVTLSGICASLSPMNLYSRQSAVLVRAPGLSGSTAELPLEQNTTTGPRGFANDNSRPLIERFWPAILK